MDLLRTVINQCDDDTLRRIASDLRREASDVDYVLGLRAARRAEAERNDAIVASLPPTRREILKALRTRRLILIMTLARRGFTNADIAAVVDMHPKSVGRIIRDQLAAADVPISEARTVADIVAAWEKAVPIKKAVAAPSRPRRRRSA